MAFSDAQSNYCRDKSRGHLVVEAKRRSGSLITANYAVHEGREVFAVPGHILNPCSVGTNELNSTGGKVSYNSRGYSRRTYLMSEMI